jgi:hypothetical protein
MGDFRPGGEDAETPRDHPLWPTPRKRCVERERRAVGLELRDSDQKDASPVRLARAAVRNAS